MNTIFALIILCSPATDFVDKFLPMRQVPCPEKRPGCLVVHWERPETFWWDYATHWDDKTMREFHSERVKFIKAAFGWQGWEGQNMGAFSGKITVHGDVLTIQDAEGNIRLERAEDLELDLEAMDWEEQAQAIEAPGSCRCEGNPKP